MPLSGLSDLTAFRTEWAVLPECASATFDLARNPSFMRNTKRAIAHFSLWPLLFVDLFCYSAGLRTGGALKRFIQREVRRDRGHRHHHDQESAAPGRQRTLAMSAARS